MAEVLPHDYEAGQDLVSCPGCDSTRAAFVLDDGPAFRQMAGSVSFTQPDYHICECAECGLLFRNPPPSPEQLREYYVRVNFQRWQYGGLFPAELQVLRVLNTIPPGGSVLDFGCSSGRLLSHVSKDLHCFGFEINETAALEAGQKGIAMLSQRELQTQCEDRFDAVLLVDVFEHLDRPAALLKQLWSMIRPGGRLIVSTGNGDYWACRLSPATFWYFRNYEHLSMLTWKYAAHLSYIFGRPLGEWRKLSHYEVPFMQQMLIWLVFFRYILRKALRKTLFCSNNAEWRRSPDFIEAPPTCAVGADHVVAVWYK